MQGGVMTPPYSGVWNWENTEIYTLSIDILTKI